MIDYLEHSPLNFDKYYTKFDEINLKQIDANHIRSNLELKEKLVQLVKFSFMILKAYLN
jgi:hypothetical protein